MYRFLTAAVIVALPNVASASLVQIPFTGAFDEATIAAEGGLPAGDYDTFGGVEDVALFNLVEGMNTFTGSLYSPLDTADVFRIGILEGFRLVGAQITWGMNLTVPYGFPYPPGYLQQSSWSQPESVSLFLEQDTIDPVIFAIENLVAGPFGDETETFFAPMLDVGPGTYLSSLIDYGATCAVEYIPLDPPFLYGPQCADGIDYRITYIVEAISAEIPLPAGFPLLLAALGGLIAIRRKA